MSDTVKTMILTFIKYKIMKMKAFEYKLKECLFYEVDDLSYCIVCTYNFLVMGIKKGSSKLPPKVIRKGLGPLTPALKVLCSTN